jgi:hypothetical protein
MHMAAVVLASVIAGGAPAYADPEALNPDALDLSVLDRAVAPTPRALEIAIGGGYTQGAGGAGGVGAIEDVSGAGGGPEVQVGVRMTPRFSVGAYGTLARFRHGDAMADGSRAYGATAGVEAILHARPTRSFDPWISVGAGWRGLWISPNNAATTTAHGVELLRVQLGVDYRITPAFAIAPVIGASASLFLVDNTGMTADFTALHDNRLNLYGYTGLAGRFDLGL